VLEKLEKHAVLSAIYPQLHFDSTAASRMALRRDALPASGWNLGSERRRELAYLLWLAYFSPKQAEEVAERLAFSRQLKDSLRTLVVLESEFRQIAEMSPSQLVSKLEQLPLLAVFALYLLVEDPAIQDKLEFFAREWRHVRPRLNGYDLQQRGLPPGPRYRQTLEGLRAAWLDGEVSSSEEEIMLLEKWLEND
jgi:tRNA nucleotidyltransferase/poly(A) polymerase